MSKISDNTSLGIQVKMEGEYRLQVFNNGELKEDTGFFKNLLTDHFFNLWLGGTAGSSLDVVRYCGVGTGTTAPTVTDTTLAGGISASVAVTTGSVANAGQINTTTLVYQFAESAIIGTITEIGLSQYPAYPLTSRSLIKTPAGDPTSITLISGDTLYVSWRCSITVPSADVTGTVDFGGVLYNYVLRPAGYTYSLPASNNLSIANFWTLSEYTNWHPSYIGGFFNTYAYASNVLGSSTGWGSDTGYAASSSTLSTYVPGNFSRTLTVNWAVASGNAPGGVGSIGFHPGNGNGGGFQCSFASVIDGSPIPKDATKSMSVSLTVTYTR